MSEGSPEATPVGTGLSAGSDSRNQAAFDEQSAQFGVRWVPLRRVVDLLQMTHRPDCVAAYRERMGAGERFPPISVVRIGGYYLVADGHKRLQAYLGLAECPGEILVECWPWRRWLVDQWDQFDRKCRQLRGALRPGQDRRQSVGRLLGDVLRHWWRVVCSLSSLLMPRRRRPPC